MAKQTLKFKTKDFTMEEFKQVIRRAKDLIKKGYFTGINLIQSTKPLPESSIIIHFLHDSKKHIKSIESKINLYHEVIPRFTCYCASPKYFRKLNFKEEYKNSIFLDSDFNIIPMREAIKDPKDKIILNEELDLIIPIDTNKSLEEIVRNLRKSDKEGSETWEDPVIIIKTEFKIRKIPRFLHKYFVSLIRNREEFYSVLSDKQRVNALERYVNNLCQRTKVGTIKRSDIVFYPSQINEEFMRYLLELQRPLRI